MRRLSRYPSKFSKFEVISRGLYLLRLNLFTDNLSRYILFFVLLRTNLMLEWI